MPEAFTLVENASLARLNTLRVAATARWLAELRDADALPPLLASPAARGHVLVLGQGSNVLFAGDFPGMVLRPDILAAAMDASSSRRAAPVGARPPIEACAPIDACVPLSHDSMNATTSRRCWSPAAPLANKCGRIFFSSKGNWNLTCLKATESLLA